MAYWGFLVFVIGILYGWLSPGRQNKGYLFKSGVLIGVILAVVLGLIAVLTNSNPLGVGTGMLSIIVASVILALLFIIGVWLGDLIEGATRGRQRTIR